MAEKFQRPERASLISTAVFQCTSGMYIWFQRPERASLISTRVR